MRIRSDMLFVFLDSQISPAPFHKLIAKQLSQEGAAEEDEKQTGSHLVLLIFFSSQ